MNDRQKQTFDIKKRQQSAFDAAVDNSKMANETIKSSQNWLLLLGLAEISFLGSLLLMDSRGFNLYLIKILIVFLLIAFILFIIASLKQFKHLLLIARTYNEISNKAVTQYLNKDIQEVNKIPQELNLPEKQIISSNTTNCLFSISYILVILVTIGIMALVISF